MHMSEEESVTDSQQPSTAIPIVGRQSTRPSVASTAISSVTASFSSSLGREIDYRRSLNNRAGSFTSLSSKAHPLNSSDSEKQDRRSPVSVAARQKSPRKTRPASLVVFGSNGIGLSSGIGGVGLVREPSTEQTTASASTARVVTAIAGQLDPAALDIIHTEQSTIPQPQRGSLRSLLNNTRASRSSASLVTGTAADVTVAATTTTVNATPITSQLSEQLSKDSGLKDCPSIAKKELSVVAAQLALKSDTDHLSLVASPTTMTANDTNNTNKAVAEAVSETVAAISYHQNNRNFSNNVDKSSQIQRRHSVTTQTTTNDMKQRSEEEKPKESGGWWFYCSSEASASTSRLPMTSTEKSGINELSNVVEGSSDMNIDDKYHPKGLQCERSATMPITSSNNYSTALNKSSNTSETKNEHRKSWWFYGGDYESTTVQEEVTNTTTTNEPTAIQTTSQHDASIDVTNKEEISTSKSDAIAAPSSQRSSWWFGYYTAEEQQTTIDEEQQTTTAESVVMPSVASSVDATVSELANTSTTLYENNSNNNDEVMAAASGSWWPFNYWNAPESVSTIEEEPEKEKESENESILPLKKEVDTETMAEVNTESFSASTTYKHANGHGNNNNSDDGNHSNQSRSSWFFTWRTAPETIAEPVEEATAMTETATIAQETAMLVEEQKEEVLSADDNQVAKPSSGYLWSWWYGELDPTVSTTESTDIEHTEEKHSNESTTSHAISNDDVPVNPLISTMPSTRSAWSYFFSSSATANAQAQRLIKNDEKDKADVETSTSAPSSKKDAKKKNNDTALLNEQEKSDLSPASSEKKPSNSKDQNTANGSSSQQQSRRGSVSSTPSRPASSTGHRSKNVTNTFESISNNYVLPAFEADLARRSNQMSGGIVAQAVEAVSSYLFPSRQVTRPRVKKVAIIGVHGWVPVKLIQKMFGEPTGTSEKFCEQMEKAVRQFLYETHQIQLAADAITLIPLNGEGKILHRVEKLYAALMAPERASWRQALTEADCVFVTTHSQGTPVSTMLLARLLREGLVRTDRQRVCLLAMAGISHGPFPFLKDNVVVRYVEADAARELFHFMDAEREVSVCYRKDMHTVLKQGVKVVCVGSMADQVVPLYSGIMHGFSHPSLLRAIYIDGIDYTGDFLTSLISFALRLRNHGIHDHGLIVYLSEAIAGSLYSGTQGHSTIYEELQVYTLAVRWLFDAHPEPPRGQSLEHPADPVLTPFQADERLNPYYLPWIMRGLLEDRRLRKNAVLLRDVEQLQRQFDQWDPVSRPMKELKFRLEPLRARL